MSTPPSPDFDVIVVGSGPSGAQAAHTAVAHGAKVALVDVGHVDDTYAGTVPDRPFSEVRRYDPAQSRFFLGEHLEGALARGHGSLHDAVLHGQRTDRVEEALHVEEECHHDAKVKALGQHHGAANDDDDSHGAAGQGIDDGHHDLGKLAGA